MKKINKGFVVWLTGLSGAGKSTLALKLFDFYQKQGLAVERLDGDLVRAMFPQTGFSKNDRHEHIQRMGFIASLLERNGIIVIASFISPYEESRKNARNLCRHFIEVYVDASLKECERRDPKGLYQKARAGQIKYFTGIDDPYETPQRPDITVKTEGVNVDQSYAYLLEQVKMHSHRL